MLIRIAATLRAAATVLLMLASAAACAATTTTVVDVVTRPGVTQRFLYVRPDAPKATIVSITGGSGILLDPGRRFDDHRLESRCGPIERNRQAFADAGFAVALLDQTSTGGVGQPQEVAEAVRYLRARDRRPDLDLRRQQLDRSRRDQCHEPAGHRSGRCDVLLARTISRHRWQP